ncbi:hypothetical protein KGM_204462 [Danaus plexippus plexippus]|uniref:Uncharacterized protein n=1 Tax=Danaus plexippus plexippus TaxID=278856 RepID=A0A212F471_DANPL|nr:hypothetical protein KGM_204462 [Danaus plexippus plexippus]
MEFVSLRSSLRIVWATVVMLLFLTKTSAAPAFGETNKAMCAFSSRAQEAPSTFRSHATAALC